MMKGTASPIVAPLSVQRDIAADNLHNVVFLFEFLHKAGVLRLFSAPLGSEITMDIIAEPFGTDMDGALSAAIPAEGFTVIGFAHP